MLRSTATRRPLIVAVAAALAFVSLIPALLSQKASAYAVLGTRSIRMSSSQISATSTSYEVNFRPTVATLVKSIVVDFCSESPIVGDACTVPTGFTVTGTPSVTIGAGFNATWTADDLNSGRTLTLTKAAGDTFATGSDNTFTITTVTNPSGTGSFYARIFTYPNDTGNNSAANYTSGTVGTGNDQPTDAGGIALSTAAQITITSKVQERLVFCVYTDSTDPDYGDNDCTSQQGTTVNLGDDNGVLDPAGPYVDIQSRYTVSTNASGNAAIRMKGATLTSGSNSIDAMTGTANTSTAGTEEFGFCTYQQAGTGLTPASPYDDASCAAQTSQTAGTATPGGAGTATFAFDSASLSATYGQTIASKAAGNFSTGEIAFLGNIANATEAGIYTATLTFIATGTY